MGATLEILSLPDNVPIVLLMILLPFYTWYGLRQAFANDRLIGQLEADPELAKTHHRKVQPFQERLVQRGSCLAFLAANRISGDGDRDRHLDGVVDLSGRPARGAPPIPA